MSDEQLSMWADKRVAGVQTKIGGSKFAADQQPTREMDWDEELIVVARVVVKRDTGYKSADTEQIDGRTVHIAVREQALEVVEFYEVDNEVGAKLLEAGHEEAMSVIADRVAVGDPNVAAMAS